MKLKPMEFLVAWDDRTWDLEIYPVPEEETWETSREWAEKNAFDFPHAVAIIPFCDTPEVMCSECASPMGSDQVEYDKSVHDWKCAGGCEE